MSQKNLLNFIETKVFSPKGVRILLLFITTFLIVSAFMFGWNRVFTLGSTIDHEVFGTLGDFIGGILNPILAILAVIVTYIIFTRQSLQTQTIHNEQKALSEIQRFNSLFFELLNLHFKQKEVLRQTPLICSNSTNKEKGDFFLRAFDELHSNMPHNSSYGRMVKMSQRRYLQLYLSNTSSLAAYFRILYRIFDLIDKSQIPDKEKVRYAKIMRAQLSEQELSLLRYNAMSPYGAKFIVYINRYRLLKHLPVLSLLEFKPIKNLLGEGDALYQYSLNMFFYDLSRKIYNISIGREPRQDKSIKLYDERSRYKFELIMSKPYYTRIYMIIDDDHHNTDPYLKCFRTFSDSDFEKLFTNLLKEIYISSNFSNFNNIEDIKFKSQSFIRGSRTYIYSKIYNRNKHSLRVSDPSRD